MPGALDGIRVLDFTQMMLGPWATQLLGDLGADVIKVERAGVGEWERSLAMNGGLCHGESSAFLAMNRNKRSVAVDLKDPDARTALLSLAATCDVVVENFRPGVLARLGLGYEDVRAARSDIVYCSGSGWGQDTAAARANRPGQDLLIQAGSGLAANNGRRGGEPTFTATSFVDASTALTLTAGLLAALLVRERRGIGQWVQVDLFSTAMALQCQEISALVNQGGTADRSESGIAAPWLSAPCGMYRTADGWLAVAMGLIETLAGVVGQPGLAKLDPWRDRDEIKRTVEAIVLTRTTDDWLAALLAAGLWAARVRTTEEAVQSLRDEGSPLIVRTTDPVHGELELIGCPITFSETPWEVRYPPPAVGEHTREVLEPHVDAATLARWAAAEVVPAAT